MTTPAELDALRARLASYLAAEQRLLKEQEHTIGSGGAARRWRGTELAPVQLQIRELQRQIEAAEVELGLRRPRRRIYHLR